MLLRIANFLARWTHTFPKLKKSNSLVLLVHYLEGLGGSGQLVKWFTFNSAIIMLLGMIGIGWWVGEQIKDGVIKQSASSTALYMDSFIAPYVQELNESASLTPEHIEALNKLFSENNLGQRTVSIKIWSRDHRIAYSNIPSLIGRKFPDTSDLVSSWLGNVTGEISNLQEAENIEERQLSSNPLLEIYSPVRLNDTNQIVAVAEFYQKVDTLELEIAAVQRRGWLVVGTTMLIIYFLLIGFVQLAGRRIEQQELELENQVQQLTHLLARNKELTQRIHLAAANTVAIHESILRRTSAELHDGPVQEVSLSLLRLDRVMAQNEICRLIRPDSKCNEHLPAVQLSLQTSLRGMRTIAAGFGLPNLDGMTLPELINHVIHSHEQRTKTDVTTNIGDLPEQTSLPVKIAVYRLIQEALNNSFRHAGGKRQDVQVFRRSDQMQIEVSDHGPGLAHIKSLFETEDQIGLAGMRERIESLGGIFMIDDNFKEGAKLIARLSLF